MKFHNATKLCDGAFDQQDILDRLEKLEKIIQRLGLPVENPFTELYEPVENPAACAAPAR